MTARGDDPIYVLYVDDDEAIAETTASLLERESDAFEVETAVTPEEALSIVAESRIDCVVSDYRMPDMDGLEFFELLKERHPTMPFVLYTGKGSEQLASKAVTSGVTDYVIKATDPDEIGDLASRIDRAVASESGRGIPRSPTRGIEEIVRDVNRALVRTSTRSDVEEAVCTRLVDGERYTLAWIGVPVGDDLVSVTYATGVAQLEGARLRFEEGLTTNGVRVARGTRGEANLRIEHDEGTASDTSEVTRTIEGEHTAPRAFVPLEYEGEIYGVLGVHSDRSDAFDTVERESLADLGDDVAHALFAAETQSHLIEITTKIEALHQVAIDLDGCESREAVCTAIVEAASDILSFDLCVLALGTDDGLEVEAASADLSTELRRSMVTGELARETVRTGQSRIVRDASEHTDDAAHSYRSILSVPVGERGVFQAIAEDEGAFDATDSELAELLVDHARTALDRLDRESRLHERDADLLEQRDRFAALFENVPDPVVAFELRDGEAIVNDVNAAFEAIFGWDGETITGENLDEYVVPPGSEDEATRLNERLHRGESLQVETRRATADGIRDVLLQVVPLDAGERNVEGFAIYTDITEQKRRERELKRQNERLDQFASIVSHDLRNPINLAKGRLELAREEAPSEHLDGIESALDRMGILIEDLLALARQGKTVSETEPVDLCMMIESAWEVIDDASATLEFESDLGELDCDASRVTQLFENLFRNAVEHGASETQPTLDEAIERAATTDETGEGCGDAGTAGVTIGVGELPDDPGFFVEDDGPGIPEEKRDVVFEGGYTTSAEGTGLGLTIVEEVVEAHGWNISVTEGTYGGARFEIRTNPG